MGRLRKTLGPRPDPHPEIPAAGAVVDTTGQTKACDCLDHGERVKYKKNSLDSLMAHIPGKLPKNITDLTDKARTMTHGVKPMPGPTAADVIFPHQSHPLLQARDNNRETIYHRREHQVLGTVSLLRKVFMTAIKYKGKHYTGHSVPSGTRLPAFIYHPDFKFGMSTLEEESAKEIMYPFDGKTPQDDDKVRRQYIISHGSYRPGERRQHYGPNFVAPSHEVSKRDKHDNDGKRTKEVMYWHEEIVKELQTKVVSKRLADWRERRQPEIGKVHDPLKDTMSHLPSEHVFGIRFPADDYNVGDLIGGGKKVKDNKGKVGVKSNEKGVAADEEDKDKEEQENEVKESAVVEESQPAVAATTESSNLSRKKLKELIDDDLTPKITSTPMGGIRPRRLASVPETHVFGVPTVRTRAPGFVKRLSDNNNYGDELDAKALLLPTPQNMYGEELLQQFAKSLQLESQMYAEHLAEQAAPPRPASPAKVHPVPV
ncbi:hypothetical protein HDU76_003593 [Blyttiomyces sp. JEL0837]|nr:hypothetical protein HDU76_003593 [Blyttiomyces sp. JEL0837]